MKRFTDASKWQDPWFRRLSGPAKLLWHYLLDHADAAGVVELDFQFASEDCRMEIRPEHVAEMGDRVEMNGGLLLLRKFIRFQYGQLSEECRPHKKVLELIQKRGLHECEDGTWAFGEAPKPTTDKKPKKDAPKKPAKPGKDKPESREEFDAYFKELGLMPRDADFGWEKWEGTGWRNGPSKIRDWKQTVRSWKTAGYWPSQRISIKDEKQWDSAPAKPSWLPENWREIAARFVGEIEAHILDDHTQIPKQFRYEFEMACRDSGNAGEAAD